VATQRVEELCDGRAALADRAVNADDPFAALVDDRIERDGRFAGLAVSEDQLALAATDRQQRIDDLQSRLQRLRDGRALQNRRRRPLDRPSLPRADRAALIDGVTECVHYAAEQLIPA